MLLRFLFLNQFLCNSRYISKMPWVTSEQMAMEKTPGYFHHPETPKRVLDTARDAKLLLIVRDPVKRLVSDYNQFRYTVVSRINVKRIG